MIHQVFPSKPKARKKPVTRTTTAEDKAFTQPVFEHMGCVMPKIVPQSWGRRVELGSRQSQYRYRQMHFIKFIDKYPLASKAGEYFFDDFDTSKKPSNLLTDLVHQYLKWEGHEPNRIDTKGTAVVDRQHAPKMNLLAGEVQFQTKVKFIPTKTETGTEDIDVKLITHLPYAVSWAIEIKTGRDTQSDEQTERQERLRSKNAWSDVVSSMDDFFRLYDEKLKLLNQ